MMQNLIHPRRRTRASLSELLSAVLFMSVAFAFQTSSVIAASPEYDRFEEAARVGGATLPLHGQGTRKATLFAVEVYHAAFYAPSGTRTLAEVLTAPRPLRLDIRYVRDFDLSDTNDAWVYQFRESSGRKPEEIAEDLRQLISFQKEIKKGDLHRFDFERGKTVFYINDDRRGEIAGDRFQTALLTIFFGSNPPTKELQRGLLAGPKPSAVEAARTIAESTKTPAPKGGTP